MVKLSATALGLSKKHGLQKEAELIEQEMKKLEMLAAEDEEISKFIAGNDPIKQSKTFLKFW